jgi:hypothetical protein
MGKEKTRDTEKKAQRKAERKGKPRNESKPEVVQKKKKKAVRIAPVKSATRQVADDDEEDNSKGRRFAADLRVYLDMWENRDTCMWKFNKTLQSWAVLHCLNIDRIDNDLFDKLCPYIQTIQGGTLDRLREACSRVVDNDDDENPIDENSIHFRRAKFLRDRVLRI